MNLLRRLSLVSVLVAFLFGTGCSPSVIATVETEVFPDYTCSRLTRMEISPNPRFPNQRPRLGDYYQFPPAELYDSYAVQYDKVVFAGLFDSYEQIPHDLVRGTPGAGALAGNVFSFRVMDLALFVLADFDETLTDIVASREDGETALGEILRLLVPEVMSVLNAKYGTKYDLTRLEAWLYNDFPLKLKRVYAGAWAIHSAKRSGVTSPGEDYEYYMFLKAEARREGLELVDPGTPDMQRENIRRLKEYAVKLAERLCPPRAGGPGVGQENFSGIAVDELLASVQKAITARHGSVNAFVAKIASLVPRAFGAYGSGTMMPIYMLPETTYRYRLKAPGVIIQTNGVREMDGSLVWSFADRDLIFTGQSMWARSIFVRETATYALDLKGFPASLADVDKLFGFCLSPSGTPREGLLMAMRQAVADGNQGPLEALAGNPNSPDSQAARGVLDMFDRHRKARVSARSPSGSLPPSPLPGDGQSPLPQSGGSPQSDPRSAAPRANTPSGAVHPSANPASPSQPKLETPPLPPSIR